MKRTFMIGVAAGALLAGVNIAAAQGAMERERQPGAAGGGGANIEQKSGGAQQQQQQKGRSGAEMQADSPGGKARAQAQDKGQAQENMKPTTGQGQQSQQGQRMQDTQRQGDQQKAQDAQSKPDGSRSGTSAQGDTKSGGSTTAQGAAGGKVSLNTEQKTRIRETVIRSSNAPRVNNVNFSISVGTVVPRTVRFAPLPPLLVEINPGWRGYEYFIINEQIVIIEPGTLRIVAVLDV